MKKCRAQNELKTEYLLPERVLLSKNADGAERLLCERERQPFLDEAPVCVIKKGGFVLFDFGEELQGGADVIVQSSEKQDDLHYSSFRAVFGESAAEAMSEIGEKNATNDHSTRDIILEASFLSHMTFGNTGFRFLRLEAVDGEIGLKSVQAVSRFRDLEYKGSFVCSDDRLNRIWQVGARTVHLNMQEYLWDGIKRDRLVWSGDMGTEMCVISSVFGDTEVVRRSLDLLRDATPSGKYMNGIMSYSLQWIINHYNFYNDFGDRDYLEAQLDTVAEILEMSLQTLESGVQVWRFTEWSSSETADENAAFCAILILSLSAGADILDIFGREPLLSAKCREKADELRQAKPEMPGNKQVAAILGLSGICDLHNICETVIKPGGARGLSTFWGYHVLNALADDGDMKSALDITRDFWGAMTDLGATTFWEDFDMSWLDEAPAPIDAIPAKGVKCIHGDFGKFCYIKLRLSLCHGWAGGPTAFLSKRVLGVTAAEPGYSKIRITPMLGDLDFAEGSIPTPYGIIKVRHERQGEIIKTDISLPLGVEIADEDDTYEES